jgi:DNA-directed RNA polymerase specialized sigma24 family protein
LPARRLQLGLSTVTISFLLTSLPARVLAMKVVDPPTTSPTLLRLLGWPGSEEAWVIFVERYSPLVLARCLAAGLQAADADDIRAEVFGSLVAALRAFRYDPARRFRGYLCCAVDNAIRTHWRVLARRPGWVGRGGPSGDDLPEPLAQLADELDDQILARFGAVARVLDRVRFEVGPDAWQAFWLTVVDGLPGGVVAARLGKSVASVYMAKCRVLASLRDSAGGATSGD